VLFAGVVIAAGAMILVLPIGEEELEEEETPRTSEVDQRLAVLHARR